MAELPLDCFGYCELGVIEGIPGVRTDILVDV